MAEVDVKNKFVVGDELELILPEGNHNITLESMQNMYGCDMNEVLGGGYEIKITLPAGSSHGVISQYIK